MSPFSLQMGRGWLDHSIRSHHPLLLYTETVDAVLHRAGDRPELPIGVDDSRELHPTIAVPRQFHSRLLQRHPAIGYVDAPGGICSLV